MTDDSQGIRKGSMESSAPPPIEVHPSSPQPIWLEDKEVRIAVSNAMTKLERWRRLRYGRTLREVPLANFSRGLVEELRGVLTEDDQGKPIPSMLTDEELTFCLQAATLLVMTPLLSGDEQAALVRGVVKGRVAK